MYSLQVRKLLWTVIGEHMSSEKLCYPDVVAVVVPTSATSQDVQSRYQVLHERSHPCSAWVVPSRSPCHWWDCFSVHLPFAGNFLHGTPFSKTVWGSRVRNFSLPTMFLNGFVWETGCSKEVPFICLHPSHLLSLVYVVNSTVNVDFLLK